MEPEARALMAESLNVNSIDQDEYPATTEIQNRCVSMLADLFHADDAEHAMGPRRSARPRPSSWPAWR